MPMHVISKKRIKEFWRKHPEAEACLTEWYKIVKNSNWNSFSEVRNTLNSVDRYRRCHIFNVGGNKYRIIAAIHYNSHRIFIRHVLTHKEYDRGKWKAECKS